MTGQTIELERPERVVEHSPGLTHSLDYGKEGLAVNATRNDHTTWLPVVGYEGLYEVSDRGSVRSALTGRELGQTTNRRGYRVVALSKDGHRSAFRVHRIVARAFLGETELPVVRHLNDVPSDNRVVNLAYGTQSDNQHDSVRNGSHTWAAKTHCPQGHAYDDENTRLTPEGYRVCRACRSQRLHDALPWKTLRACDTCGALITKGNLARHNRRAHEEVSHV